jgi:outer membrane protein OmpA-like peptidoglycan-associated protein
MTGLARATIAFLAAASPQLSAQAPPKIPLTTGLQISHAIESPKRGDYETMVTVEKIDSDGVHIVYTGATVKKPVRRTVRAVDLESSRHYQLRFGLEYPEVVPNSTALGTSKLVLSELKGGRDAEFSCCLLQEFNRQHLAGTLKRVESKPVMISVLVNDQRVQLPAIHAAGKLWTQQSDFYFLDDPENPISLRWQVGKQGLRVIRISFPTGAAVKRIESGLAKTGRVELHGIYFDIGSATIRPESEPVLKEIGDALSKNASWNLSVEGHTDNVGGDAANLDLSRRRAASVKDALVSRYHVAAARLTTAGFGASRPKETNDTLEGRARNRRVELVKQ